MVRGRKRESVGKTPKSAKKMKHSEAINCDVNEILGYRIAQKSDSADMEFLVSWKGFDSSHNSWEPYDNLRMNEVLSNHINKTFAEKECQIYVTIANIKEQIKKKIRRSLGTKKKMEIMLEVQPFDPKEYRTTLGFFHLMKDPSDNFKAHLEDLVYRSYFFEMEKCQRIKHDKIVETIKEKDKDIMLMIENDEDFEVLPNFEYITKNFFANELNATIYESPTKSDGESKGCRKTCTEGCSKATGCCPKIANEPFPYKRSKKGNDFLSFKETEKIYECGENCSCGIDCINRVSQRPSTASLCVFKTLDHRGWGVKAVQKIREGTFIMEYRGELVGHYEASKRQESMFLFDLNMDRLKDGFYTIDAFKHGSLARFVNHSCDPNAKMWFVNDCNRDPKNQKLCIFADRNIEADEEITIDYSPKEGVPTSGCNLNESHSQLIECNCGTTKCRGNIY